SAAPAGNEPSCNGQGLIVDHPTRVALAMVRTGAGGLIGLWMEPGRWILHRAEPAFHLTDGWQEFLPALRMDPAAEACQRAWQVWCQPRSLPQAEVERCSLHLL